VSHLAAARRAALRQLQLVLLEVPLGVTAGEADGDPIAESLPPLLSEPVGGFAHRGWTVLGGPITATASAVVTVEERMAVAREAEPVTSLSEVKEAGLDREDLLGVYRSMVITRGIEERGHILYKQGKIPGSFYTGRGNEAASVGVATAMGSEDVGTPIHRDMGVHIVRGVEPWRIFAQYMGRADGPTKGKDGNVHMADSRLGLIAMVSHLPAMLPVAVGCALAFRIRDEKRVAVAWYGEGASARGDTHEGMNFAGVRRLPVVFICDNNQWAYSTPTHLEYACENLADRARTYGFDGVVVDGTDVLAVYREAKRAIEKAREGGGPTLVECLTLRMEGHAVHDDAFYVPKEMFEEWAKRDPIERFRSWLRENAEFSDEEEEEIRADVKKLLNDSIKRADESPLPDPSTVLDGVFATPEDLDTPHHK
jgi:TPP-dependent pyruvate/acetoin dehydrogenase alpha subunit